MKPVPEVSPKSVPEPARARIEMLDAIRGFALFGILLMNLEAFNGPILGAIGGIDSGLQGLDYWADALIYVLVQGKFWTLFSLLFGIGFAVMHDRARIAGVDFEAIYRRRLFFLMVIGLAHLWLIWEGDILFSYAVAGFVLLGWYRSGSDFGLPAIIAWFCAPLLLLAGIGILNGTDPKADGYFGKELAEQARILGSGTYADVMRWRIGKFGQDLASTLFLLPMTVAMFALGVRFYRQGLANPPACTDPAISRFGAWIWCCGLFLMLLSVWIAPEIDPTKTDGVFAAINSLNLLAGALMCVGMYFGLRWSWTTSTGRRLLQPLAPMGRMALSNYLAQSLVCTLVFNGYGFGAYQQLGRVWHIPFALALVATQAVFSRIWLQRFTMGPVEYLWRWATYRKRPKFVS